MLKAILFDFDGTILDTETVEYEAWRAIFTAYQVDLPLALWATGVGVGAKENPFNPYQYLEAQLPPGVSITPTAIRAERDRLFLERLDALPPRPGIVALLDAARAHGLKIGCASSSAHAWVDGHLKRLGLYDYFDAIRCADDVAHTKPDPELYVSLLAVLEIDSHEAIALEDSPNGIAGAKAAGLYCLATPNPLTALLPLDHADRIVPDLAAISPEDIFALLGEVR